ncbi:peroxisomal succinyl-coenzyme A thioesterase-like [Thunnus albacares]|uniref:peroxisomal succinyl-coenzyme A thioesterase-like n=1 Tax=Thunnus albacares TaxID=8236 RepID=UPI001CF63C08|nr:peroxisomal succinyl-coenzyme A thioesterase-like [Thunnus albacares]
MDREQCCVKLSVQPSRGLVDEKFTVLVQHVPPGSQLTVHALHQCEDGHTWEAFAHYIANATGTVVQNLDLENTVIRRETSIIMYSKLFLVFDSSEGPGPFPGLLDLWGGEGHLLEYRVALLASHGFASLTLDYLTPKIASETGKMVDNQYFETAFRVLQQHPQVLGSRIGMMGLSLGASFTLKMAAYSEVIKLSSIVCINGTHVQPVNGSVEEMLEYCRSNAEKTRFNEENQVIWRDLPLPIPTDPELKVDVGRLQCPVMLVVAEDDQNWPASESAQDMKEMMEQAGNSHLLTILSYPNASHLIEPPYTPHFRASSFKTVDRGQTFMALWGGDTVPHARAQEDAWRKMLAFLQENFYGSTKPAATSLSHL